MRLKRLLPISLVILSASGCSMLTNVDEQTDKTHVQQTVNINTMQQAMLQNNEQQASPYVDTTQFVPVKHHKTLVNYVEQMALDLTDTMQSEDDRTIAVTTFVKFDKTLNNSTQLGNQIAETFIHQLQKFGYGIVDFKTAENITVNSQGDFAFSREINKLASRKIAEQVLSGTLINRPNGVEVNARIIDITSKRVLASSQKILPNFVLSNANINPQPTSIN
ncbi:flagellar biosynthesis protein FlgO [Pseudoalteromonas sp. MMG010]|nr:flagellar biosynthesis protein FlgO [Pseudoalteromonas sp. MMG010]